ncbi:diacylglycerol/lipid kinase family protein [Agromyces bauzanensis]
MMTPHAAIVYNPANVPVDRLRRAVGEEQRRLQWEDARWYPTSRDDRGQRAATAAVAGGPAVIVVAGGDGTVRSVVEALHGSGTPLGLVPAGTGNLLARNLGLELGDLEASVRTAFRGATRPVDTVTADLVGDDGERTHRIFVVMAGIGLDAEMAETTSELAKRRMGWLAYVRPIARSIIMNRQFHVRYRIDGGGTRSARAHTIIIGNCGTLTGNMLLLPTARVDDGLLDVVMMRPKGRFGWWRIAARLILQGLARHLRRVERMMRSTVDLRSLAYAQGRGFDVRFESPHGIELDGDSFDPIIAAQISIQPAALNVRVAAR